MSANLEVLMEIHCHILPLEEDGVLDWPDVSTILTYEDMLFNILQSQKTNAARPNRVIPWKYDQKGAKVLSFFVKIVIINLYPFHTFRQRRSRELWFRNSRIGGQESTPMHEIPNLVKKVFIFVKVLLGQLQFQIMVHDIIFLHPQPITYHKFEANTKKLRSL